MSTGKTVQIIGAVVDVEFPRESLPKIFNALTIEESGLTQTISSPPSP